MKRIKFVREANWYGLFTALELYADGSDELELGRIAAGEIIELALSAEVTSVYGEMSGIPTEWLSAGEIKDGDTIVIRSFATIFNFFSMQHLPLEFRILTPGELIDVGSKKQKTRSIIKALAISVFLMVATIAWLKEGWRLSGYDSRQQMELAKAGGFSDKGSFLNAQALGINATDEWEKLLSAMAAAGFDDPAEFSIARELEFTQYKDWLAFKESMIKDRFDNPKHYKDYRRSDFQSKDEFYEAKRLGSESRIELLGDLADENFQRIEVGSDSFLVFCTNYVVEAWKINESAHGTKNQLAGVLTVIMARFLGNLILAIPEKSEQRVKLAEWITMGQQSARAGFDAVASGGDKTSNKFLTFEKCMNNVPSLPKQLLR